MGTGCPCQAGLGLAGGCFPLGHFASLTFPESIFKFQDFVPISAEVRQANIWGLKGELAGPRVGGRLTLKTGCLEGPPQAGPAPPHRGHLLLTLSPHKLT